MNEKKLNKIRIKIQERELALGSFFFAHPLVDPGKC